MTTPQVNPVAGGGAVLQKFTQNKMAKNEKVILAVISVLVIALGVGTGFLLSQGKGSKSSAPTGVSIQGAKATANEAGVTDESTFKDTAEGELKEGGVQGEGTHHLDRGQGGAKDVYLTSTVINLQNFVGKKVQVWGETIAAKHAGWLMDVGKIKVIE